MRAHVSFDPDNDDVETVEIDRYTAEYLDRFARRRNVSRDEALALLAERSNQINWAFPVAVIGLFAVVTALFWLIGIQGVRFEF